MNLKKFAEAMITQSIEDLWDNRFMYQSTDFFTGEEFHLVASMAGMDIDERIGILKLVNKVLRENNRLAVSKQPKHAGRVKKPPLIPCLPPLSSLPT
jgi:hypothetical protein